MTDLLDALGRGEYEIKHQPAHPAAMQRLHASDPLAVDTEPEPRLSELESAVHHHRSI